VEALKVLEQGLAAASEELRSDSCYEGLTVHVRGVLQE
jgi:hypothetical protein